MGFWTLFPVEKKAFKDKFVGVDSKTCAEEQKKSVIISNEVDKKIESSFW